MSATEPTAGAARQGHRPVSGRVALTTGVVTAVLASAAATAPRAPLALSLPAALSLVTLGALAAGWPRTRRFVAPATGVVTAVSLVATTSWLASPVQAGGGAWPLLQTATLMVLNALLCRWSRASDAVVVGIPTVLAESILAIPITTVAVSVWETVALCLFWSLAALVGAGAGGYLYALDAHRVRAVSLARRTQRLQLATDLHDFVAHDVSAMVVEAQAAQVLLTDNPEEVARVLRWIETDGVRALASMDRTIQVLRDLEDDDDIPRTPLPGVADLPDLVRRYANSGAGPIELEMDHGLEATLHREVGTTVYRVAVEALTNVRRHARPGAAVTVSLRSSGDRVALTVVDLCADAETAARSLAGHPLSGQRRGGLGLSGLAERVQALGGSLCAGPAGPAGWRVRAELPASVQEAAP